MLLPRRVSNASVTFFTRGWSALPLVEKESIATRGSSSRNRRVLAAVSRAISASCSALGSGITAQSAKTNLRSSGKIIKKKLENRRTPSCVPKMRRAGSHCLPCGMDSAGDESSRFLERRP